MFPEVEFLLNFLFFLKGQILLGNATCLEYLNHWTRVSNKLYTWAYWSTWRCIIFVYSCFFHFIAYFSVVGDTSNYDLISIPYQVVWESVSMVSSMISILDNAHAHNTHAYINVKFYINSVKNVEVLRKRFC